MREDEYDGVHTCHDKCKKWYCVLRKERDRYREALEKLRDGPGNKMAGWKHTWAHEVANEALTQAACEVSNGKE